MSQDGLIQSPNTKNFTLLKSNFQTQCKKLIKISDKNRIIKDKLKISSSPRCSISPESFDVLVSKQIESERKKRLITTGPSLLIPITKKLSLPQNSCFMWYLTNGKSCRNTISDYEMGHCKELLYSMAKEKPSGEVFFGLGKILFHDENWKESQYYLNECLKYSKDPLYKQWYAFISLMNSNSDHDQAVFIQELLENTLKRDDNIENYWGLMTLALTGALEVQREIEMPRFFATKIKQVDTYYGYLAYSKIFLSENDTERAIKVLGELICNNPTRPEAYILLWDLLYHIKKDYELAEDLMTQAFLRVNDSEYDSYITIFCLNLAKAYAKQDMHNYALEILQEKFVEHPGFPVFLYQYGRVCTKAGDPSFLGSAIGALEESLRLCHEKRYGKIYYWLSQAYYQKSSFFECYFYANLSLESSGIIGSDKENKLRKTLEDIKSYVNKGQILISLYKKNTDPQKCLADCEGCLDFGICRIVKAKLLWRCGMTNEAIKFLQWCIQDNKNSLKPYFLLAKYLKKQQNIKFLNKVSKKMIKIAKNSQVTTSEWMQCNLWYARSKSSLNKPEKALTLLQCLAKVFPPLPHFTTPYTNYLIHAKTANDLLTASQKAIKYKGYNFSDLMSSIVIPIDSESAILEQHSPNIIKQRREFTEKFIDDSIDEGSIDITYLMFIGNEKHHLVHKSFDVTMRRISQRGFMSMGMGAGVPTGSVFVGFSVCSELDFLYFIGKISLEHGIRYEDGLCAVEDFLVMTELEKKSEKKKRMLLKGVFLKSFLLMGAGRREQGRELFMSIKDSLVEGGMQKKLDLALKYLSFL